MNNVVHFKTRTPAKPKPPQLTALSFVTDASNIGSKLGGYCYWHVSPTGNYTDDCELGAKLASEYLSFIGQWPTNGNQTLLTCIVRDMIDLAKAGSPWSGVHVGFLSNVNGYAMTAANAMYAREA
jgi:hypothetical protein